jgi:hydroxymethylglutaryl-CoA lyase
MSKSSIVICECFARDGLQHETVPVSTANKIRLIDAFTATGFQRIEATSYSHPGRIPVFADAGELLVGITRKPGVWYKATCPNVKAVERAVADLDAGRGANELSLLVSATEAHSQRNLRVTRAGQWQRIEAMAGAAGSRFRLIGVISVALGCPFEGAVAPEVVLGDVRRFAEFGIEMVTIGDTTGLGTPKRVRALFERLHREAPQTTFIAHFHNTRGTALANAVAAYEAGCRHFDSAFGGVGGHPVTIAYGDGMTGNIATEDLVNLFEAEGVSTGLDLDRMMKTSRLCEEILRRPLYSMVARAGLGRLQQPSDAGAVHG